MSSHEENVATEEKLGNTKRGDFQIKLIAPSYEFSLGLRCPQPPLPPAVGLATLEYNLISGINIHWASSIEVYLFKTQLRS